MPVNEVLQALIQDFSSDNLVQFFRQKTRTFRQVAESVPEFDSDFFSNGLLLGEIKLDMSDEIVIYTFRTSKELTERSGKKAQYELAKKVLKQEQRYAAGFFIFYDVNKNFRFSLVYDTPLPSGKREWSNFKRFTYYVNRVQTNKTFHNRLDSADFTSFEKIKEAFSVEKVTKEFYTEIANWYFWALKNVNFPKDAEIEKNGRNIALIRFITRIIFIWFMKQKKLITNSLFDKEAVKRILKTIADKESTYYTAILQNLFFATLNTPIKERIFRRNHSFQGKNNDYMLHNYYRYHSLFNNPDDILNIFANIPFLNGGLFECLDKRKDDPSNDTGKEIRIDGFSDKEINQTIFPNFLFFSDEREVDLNKDYGTTKKKYKTRGLFNILHSYNFTIDENTPADEEIALDPELLGRVFENLLASYNPETASTARKSTGSYYTPREIVNYMVDESLVVYLKQKMLEGAKSYIQIGTAQSDMFGNSVRKGQLIIEEEFIPSRWIEKDSELEQELRKLISYSDDSISFIDKEIDILINAINNCKILDPAVGSGAFPMVVLHKLVLILSKLDPHNIKWKQQQITAIETNVADPKLKRQFIEKIEESFNRNELDYGRKLYLIQNCLYGVDVQPIAIQIAKLRFFISLLVDEIFQHSHTDEENFGIEPLPNLETKLVAANTLIGLPQILTLKSRDVEKLESKLFNLRRKYFLTSSESEKKDLEKGDRELRQEIKKVLVEQDFPAEFAVKISSWDPYNTNIAAGWFNSEWMFGPDVKDGFDILIGNPPYIGEKGNSNIFSELKSYPKWKNYYRRRSNLYYFFIIECIVLLKENGVCSLITPREFLTAEWANKLRKFILSNSSILYLIDFFDEKVFSNVSTSSLISIFKKCRLIDYKFFYIQAHFNSFVSHQSIEFMEYLKSFSINDISKQGDPWYFSPSIKISASRIINLGQFLSVSQGIVTGSDKVNQQHIDNNLISPDYLAHGIYILKKGIDFVERDGKILLKHKGNFCLEISSLDKVYVKEFISSIHLNKWVLSHSDEIFLNPTSELSEQSSIYRYLKQFDKILINRCMLNGFSSIDFDNFMKLTKNTIQKRYSSAGAVQKIMRKKLWFLPLYQREIVPFDQPKIIVNTKNMDTFTFTNREVYTNGGGRGGQNIIFFTNSKDYSYYNKVSEISNIESYLRYVNTILNSSYIQNFIKSKRFNQLSTDKIEELPLYKINFEDKNDIEIYDTFVKYSLKNDNSKQKEYNKINSMIYKLYNLTYEEVKIIDPEIEKLISEKEYEMFEKVP